MNFLAHIFLSENSDEISIGNFIGDFVKGKEAKNFPDKIALGIALHRNIDHYTDNHPIVLLSKERLRPNYHHYSPVIVDMYYDHFLAKNWQIFSAVSLSKFTLDFYQLTEKYDAYLPSAVKHMLIYMKKDNWLFQYREIEGIKKALQGMARRTKFDSGMENAVNDLQIHYKSFEQEFLTFFPHLISNSKAFISDNS